MGKDIDVEKCGSPLPLSRTFIWACSAALTIGLMRLAQARPEWVERVYSRGLYPVVRRALSWISSCLQFSLAELLILVLVVWLIWRFGRAMRAIVRGRSTLTRACAAGGLFIVRASSVSVIGFMLLWGMNHARLPLSVSVGLPAVADREGALESLAKSLAHDLTFDVREGALDSTGFGVFSEDGEPDPRISKALEALSGSVPSMTGEPPTLRRITAWPLFARLGISGIYSPFTGEPHFNDGAPACQWPYVAFHEISHQRGFAREDEANFLGWWLCVSSGDAHYRYSGNLAALSGVLGVLQRTNAELSEKILGGLPERVLMDMRSTHEFWQRYKSPVRVLSTRVNDAYLKSQGHSQGVRSYGRMVELMLALHVREK